MCYYSGIFLEWRTGKNNETPHGIYCVLAWIRTEHITTASPVLLLLRAAQWKVVVFQCSSKDYVTYFLIVGILTP